MARRSRGTFGSGEHDIAARHFAQAREIVAAHPMLAPLLIRTDVCRDTRRDWRTDTWAFVTSAGRIDVHPTRRATPEEWSYVLAHCLLHLGLEHFKPMEDPRAWNAACDYVVFQFLSDLKLGRVPDEMRGGSELRTRNERELYELFVAEGIPPGAAALGTAGAAMDLIFEPEPASRYRRYPMPPWSDALKNGIAEAVRQAVEVAGGALEKLGASTSTLSNAQRARQWFMSSYPLLGALAETFEIIEDAIICQRAGISVAAVYIASKEILINPAAALSIEEARFVVAHELMHVGLRHDVRCQGRDPYLWNVACDYVINGWLIEMRVGEMPAFGGLHDPQLKGLSAEAVYDRIAVDLRRYRKLATLAGLGACDIMLSRGQDGPGSGVGTLLDDFYRSCLARGLVYHEQEGRGLLPAGLVEEIRALQHPPIPWDVELAQWLDGYFSPIEQRRTYARPSRRQSSTPDIPRPRWHTVPGAHDGRTFGVIIDTSGSMSRDLLARALGAVAAYAISRDVLLVRVVFCDAAAYDQGYLAPDAIADRVSVRGRGGTLLQPGVTLLEKADDFPAKGPILIITDGKCDRLRIRRDHAFLVPEGHGLPFSPVGPVFRMR